MKKDLFKIVLGQFPLACMPIACFIVTFPILIITKTDKGEAEVIIDVEDYVKEPEH